MTRKYRKVHGEHEDAKGPEANPLLMIKPSVTGTPLGMLPILPIPSLDAKEYRKGPDEKDDYDRLP